MQWVKVFPQWMRWITAKESQRVFADYNKVVKSLTGGVYENDVAGMWANEMEEKEYGLQEEAVERSSWNAVRNFDEGEGIKVQSHLNQVARYFIFLDDVATDNKGRSWGREKYCRQDIKVLNLGRKWIRAWSSNREGRDCRQMVCASIGMLLPPEVSKLCFRDY